MAAVNGNVENVPQFPNSTRRKGEHQNYNQSLTGRSRENWFALARWVKETHAPARFKLARSGQPAYAEVNEALSSSLAGPPISTS